MNWQFKPRIIIDSDRNKECPISLECIDTNEMYCQCNQCKYNIKHTAIKHLFKTKPVIKCPICRNVWDQKTVYANGTTVDETIKSEIEYFGSTGIGAYIFSVNGSRFRGEDAYFNSIVPNESMLNGGINVYSFALNPEEYQPSGTSDYNPPYIANMINWARRNVENQANENYSPNGHFSN